MTEGKSLISFGDLSKPATVLIEKVSAAIGEVFRPYQVKRMAVAEAGAKKILATAEIEVAEIQQRALRRWVREEQRKQENIEAITAESLRDVQDEAKPELIDEDWLVAFFDKCKLISDSEMQTLWSRILAGEANKPGSYSRRTLDFLANIDKKDAQDFTRLMGFGWNIGFFVPFVFDIGDPIYKQHELRFATLTHLDSIGLIKFDNANGFGLTELPKFTNLGYFGKIFGVEFPAEENNVLQVGKVLLTQIGSELAPICGAVFSPTALDYVIERWQSLGLAPRSLIEFI